ncbi:hypothetical protein HDV00_008000 [Rhizophlyctis rosea]|nr:hypothetical protein HDV00_008000 [Rhizophlyctis rosea]
MLGNFCSSQAYLSTRERTLFKTLLHGHKDPILILVPYRLAITDQTSVPVLKPDEIVITDVNMAAEDLLGYTEEDLTTAGRGILNALVDRQDGLVDRPDTGVAWLARRLNEVLMATVKSEESIRMSPAQMRMYWKRKNGTTFEATVEVHQADYIFTGGEKMYRPGLLIMIRPRAPSVEPLAQLREGFIKRSSSPNLTCPRPIAPNTVIGELQHRFKAIFDGACSAVGKGFFDILLENLGAWSNFEYGFIVSAVPSMGKNEEGHHKMLRVMSFWDRKIGINPEFANVPYESENTPCYLTFKESTVLIPSGLNDAYPNFGFFKILNPPPRCYIALSISDTATGEFLGNIGLMDVTANPDELVNPEYIKLGMRVFAERVGAELKRLQIEEDLNTAREMAVGATAAKTQFLNHMSHEIRTPMNAVIGMTELLLDTPLTDEQLDLVSVVRSSGQHLLQVINNTLDFSKIEAGSLTLDSKALNVRDMIKEAIDLIRPSDLGLSSPGALVGGMGGGRERKPVVFRREVEGSVPGIILGDVTRLKQVLINIGANAYKFTDEGSITVSCKLEAPANREGKVTLKFSITDTGVGIPESSWDKLFKPFVQLDSTSCKNYQGSGLGLSIAFHLVELMGGHIWVERSTPQIGTTISFTILTIPCYIDCAAEVGTIGLLPSPSGDGLHINLDNIASSSLDRPPKARQSEWDSGLAGKLGYRIIVAEDNPVNAKMVRTMFGKLGFLGIDHAVDGGECVEMVRRCYEVGREVGEGVGVGKPYDVIFTDLLMPNMDGYTATKELNALFDSIEQAARKEGRVFKRPKIIGLSANASVEDRDTCLALGMADYLTKPVTIKDLQGVLLRLSKAK